MTKLKHLVKLASSISQHAGCKLLTTQTCNILDNAEIGHYHRKISLIASLGLFLGGFSFFIISLVIPLISKQWSIDPSTIGFVGAAAPLGAMFGAGFCGGLTDKYGRKIMLSVTVLALTLFTLLSAIAWNASSLIIFRFLLGVSIGADYPVSATYLAETMPKKIRGRKTCMAMFINCIGAVIGVLMSYFILLLYPHIESWRIMLGIGVIPSVFILFLRIGLPESPRWLISENRGEEAAEIIYKMTDEKTAITHTQKKSHFTFRDLFSKRFIRQTILTAGAWLLMDISYYGVGIFTPTIMSSMHFMSQGNFIHQTLALGRNTVFVNIFILIGAYLAVVLIERMGRIKLQALGFIVVTFSLLQLAVSPFFHTHSWQLFNIFCGFALFNIFINLGPGATTYLIPAEVYPTEIRASGHGFATSCGKIGAVLGVFFLPILEFHIGSLATVLIIALTTFLGFILTVIFGVETTGASVDEVEQLLETQMPKGEINLEYDT